MLSFSAGRRAHLPARPRPQLEQLESRLAPATLSGDLWPSPTLITLSFVPDGTIVSGSTGSNLFATFNKKFGTPAAWENIILKAAQTWAAQTNINFAVVPDNGSPIGAGSYQQGDPTEGDIRFSGFNMNNSNQLAWAFMPPPVNNQPAAGDIQFNTGLSFNSNGAQYDLYTVALHEIGHALGLDHSHTSNAVMWPSYTNTKTGVSSDDIGGIEQIYSNSSPRTPDRYDAGAGNKSFATATNLQSQINGDEAVVTGLDLTTTSDTDYYTFNAPASTSNTLTVNVQSQGLSLLTPKVTVYAADQTTVLGSASGANHYGATLSVPISGVSPGEQFYVKVTGVDNSVFSTGAYGLSLNFMGGANPSIPLPHTADPNGSPPSGGGGQTFALTSEMLVNTTTANVQQSTKQSVATDAPGNYVIVWQSQGQDGSGWGVYGQRFSAKGAPIGGEFRVNTTTVGDQTSPVVAMDALGDFVVAWQSQGQDGSGWGIYAQRYNLLGLPIGGEFRVNTTTAGDQTSPSVAMDKLGDFVVAWQSQGQDGSGWGVYARQYDFPGLSLGGEFRVNTTTAGDQTSPSVSMDLAGDFVVAWQSKGQDGSGWGVYARQYDLLGLSLGGEFRVNTTTTGDQTSPSVALDTLGNFVVVWQSQGKGGSGSGIYGQRYSLLGSPINGEFRVNGTTAGNQVTPAVAMDLTGGFIVTWASQNPDGSSRGIYAQQYWAGGTAVETEFRVNTTTGGEQGSPAVAISVLGNVAVAWSGNGNGDSDGVFAQEYQINFNGPDAYSVADGFNPGMEGTSTASPVPIAPQFLLVELDGVLSALWGELQNMTALWSSSTDAFFALLGASEQAILSRGT